MSAAHDVRAGQFGRERLEAIGSPSGQHHLRSDGVEHRGEVGTEPRGRSGDDR